MPTRGTKKHAANPPAHFYQKRDVCRGCDQSIALRNGAVLTAADRECSHGTRKAACRMREFCLWRAYLCG
jgi:hypothetical protein